MLVGLAMAMAMAMPYEICYTETKGSFRYSGLDVQYVASSIGHRGP